MTSTIGFFNHHRMTKYFIYWNVFFLILFVRITNVFKNDLAASPMVMTVQLAVFVDSTVPPMKNDSVGHFITLYLTFDDGPAEGSENISQVATSESIRINVFIIGRNVFMDAGRKQFFESYKTNPLIEIGNHSFTHANKHYRLYYKDPGQVIKDFELNADTLDLITKIARLPGRNIWRINGCSRSDPSDGNAVADSLATKGYSVFGWDLEWRYYPDSSDNVQTADSMVKMAEKAAREKRTFIPGNIVILCHDPMFRNTFNRTQLELFIKKIKEKKNYRFEHLSSYPQ
jgi:peptidoglycan/xylan/chitin deacetylase (PgdA/CDA1 family)